MPLLNKISESIKTAMKEKDSIKLESLRAVKSALILLQTEKGKGSEIPQSEEIKTLQKLVKQRKESAEIYISQNRSDLAELEINQSKIIESFLPEQISEQELRIIIMNIIDKNDASGMKDMGKVMGILKSKNADTLDFSKVSSIIKNLLK